MIVHESYDNYTSDIALIELDRPVEFNNAMSPISLPCGEFPQVGDKCWATGFGKTSMCKLLVIGKNRSKVIIFDRYTVAMKKI